MVGSSRLVAAVAASILLSAGSAHAYCGYLWYPNTVSYSYFAPPVYYSNPVWTPIYSTPIYSTPVFDPFCPTPSSIRITPLAKPTPAPPSEAPTHKEPPFGKEPFFGGPNRMAPKITESRSMGGAYAGVGVVLPRCKVGFWNLTGKDITVKVEGKNQVLPKDRAVTLELERTFTWQAPGQEPTMERVADDQNAHEVLIRPTID